MPKGNEKQKRGHKSEKEEQGCSIAQQTERDIPQFHF